MVNSNGKEGFSAESFQENFSSLIPLILDEWPQVKQDDLVATNGEWEPVVEQIATLTEHTQTLIRRHLRELYDIAVPVKSSPSDRTQQFRDSSPSSVQQLSDIDRVLELVEKRTDELVVEFKKEVLPELSEKARSNIGTSLLTALGIGFILGLLFGGGRGR